MFGFVFWTVAIRPGQQKAAVMDALAEQITAAPKLTTKPSPTPTPMPPKKPVVAFLGDSYTVGVGSSGPSKTWSARIAKQAEWTERNFGQGGTGYVTDAGKEACGQGSCPRYSGQVDELVDVKPDIVVISGGVNDLWAKSGTFDRGAARVFNAVRKRLPDVKIVAISPVYYSSPVPGAFKSMSASIERHTEAVGGIYVDIGQPLVGGSSVLAADDVHPNDRGHRLLADSTVTALRDAKVIARGN